MTLEERIKEKETFLLTPLMPDEKRRISSELVILKRKQAKRVLNAFLRSRNTNKRVAVA